MTVSSEVKRSDFAGNGSTTAFATGFRFLQNSDIKVILTVDSTGVETVQVEITNYTLTGAGLDAGGTVTMLIAPATGETLTIKRDVPLTQGTDYIENDNFPAESHEEALDKLTMIVQQIQEELDRSLKLTESQQSTGLTVPLPETNKLMQWDINGDLQNVALGELGNIVTAADLPYIQGGTGSQSRSTENKLQEIVSVKDFGAKGDGSTNDTAAIVSAFAFVAASGFILFFPAGTYLTDSITVPSNIEMYGNRSKSIIKTNNGQNNHALILSSITDVSIHDLTIDQNRTNNTLGHGIRIASSSNIDIYNMNIVETAGYGIGAQTGTLREISIRNVLIDGTVNDGIDFKNLNNDNENLHFTDITIKDFGSTTGKAGIDIRGPAMLENIYVEINFNNNVGVRFRVDDISGTGVGGRRSNASNLRIRRLAGTGTTGVITNGQHVKLANVWVEDTVAGFTDLVGKCSFVNCVAFQCTGDGFTVAGDRSSFVNCYANQCNIGFDVTGDSNQFSSPTADASVAEGFRFQAGGDNNSITGGELVGNGTKITDSGSGNVVRHLLGFVNEIRLVTTGIDAASTGTKTFSVVHGLDKVPSVANIQLTLLEDTVTTGYAFNFLRVDSIDATNINGSLNVGTASGVGGATVKINIAIHP